jgi:hypothetical protein
MTDVTSGAETLVADAWRSDYDSRPFDTSSEGEPCGAAGFRPGVTFAIAVVFVDRGAAHLARGGHYAVLEESQFPVEDVRKFFRGRR